MILTPLLWAIYCSKKETRTSKMVELLLKYGANPNFQEPKTGMTALMMCCHIESENDAFAIT